MYNYISFILWGTNSYLNNNFPEKMYPLRKEWNRNEKNQTNESGVIFVFFLSVIVFMSVSSLALPDVPKKSSNTSGNMANNGRVLKYDGWVYYSFDESGLYRMKEDGSQKKKICDGMYDNLTAYDGYIYGYCRYTKTNNPEETGLFRLKPDGTERVKISDKSMLFVTIYDGWIYYTSFDDNFKPYKMKLDVPMTKN